MDSTIYVRVLASDKKKLVRIAKKRSAQLGQLGVDSGVGISTIVRQYIQEGLDREAGRNK